jgi:tetratricopeptide (TPR) repeat protein
VINVSSEDKDYQRLLSFATGFQNRFALVLIKSPYFEVQRQWQERLCRDLKEKDIEVLAIRGNELPEELVSITSFISNRVPKTGQWVLSLSRFDYYMLPTFTAKNQENDLLSEEYQPELTPPSFLQQLNVERDAIVKVFPVPVIFWASPAAIKQMAEFAPDFYDFRQFIIDLPQPAELKTFPNIPRSSVVKTPKIEPLPDKTFRQLHEELDQLRIRNRQIDESRRMINIVNDLAASHISGEKWDIALVLLREGIEEAKRLNLLEEQAHLELQVAYSHQEIKKTEDALVHQGRSISLYKELVKKNETIYLPGLANVLNRKAVLLAEIGKRMAAREVYKEAIQLSRKLFKKEPGIRAPLLAEVLNNAALLLTEMGDMKKAEAYYREAVELYRGLPGWRYRILLALVLNNLGNLMASLNRLDEALPLHQESLHLRRLYFANEPERYRADLSQSLYNLSLLLGEMGNYQQAKNLFEEALETMSYLPDKGFKFLGCTDSQVQMCGFRIELGEIETFLEKHPAVKQAAVIVKENIPGKERLTAYIALEKKNILKVDELRNFLRKRLPAYMIPSTFVVLDPIPLTPTGKIDKKSLESIFQSNTVEK